MDVSDREKWAEIKRLNEQIAMHSAERMAENIERAQRALADYDGFVNLQIMAQNLENAANAAENYRAAMKTAQAAAEGIDD